MATKHTTIKLYSEKDISPQKIYSLSCGSCASIGNDFNNGMQFNFSGATELYNFFKNHIGEKFLINNCKGLEIDVRSIEYDPTYTRYYYSDVQLQNKVPIIQLFIYVWKDDRKTTYSKFSEIDIIPPFCYSNSGTTRYSVGLYFVWDDRNDINFAKVNTICDNLCVQSKPYIVRSGVPGRAIFSSQNETGVTYTTGNQSEKISDNEYKYIPNIGNYTTYQAYFPYTLWRYIFIYYHEQTDLSDHDDLEKQNPSQWEYPNGPGGPSKPGGGDGDQDDTSDPVPIDDVIDGLSSDFVKLYKITKANLTALSEYMLQDDFLTNIKKLYADPMDAIISLNTFPINATGTAGIITTSGVSTGINAVQINNSIIDIDCGTVAMKEYWGSFLDYETKISLFLPYVGIQAISTDDFMNDIIHVVYRVDLLSGGFVVFVKNSKGIVHQTTGNMAYHMPVTSIDYSRMYASLITGAVGLAGAAVTGGASIAAAKTATASFAAKEAFVGNAITNGANTMQNFHPQIQMSGNFGGNTGICSNKKPYLIIERPVPNVPENYSAIKGNTSNVTVKLGNCSGFTQISDMQIKHISATDAEKTQILNLLTSGVYF